jgi:hypothetical protein
MKEWKEIFDAELGKWCASEDKKTAGRNSSKGDVQHALGSTSKKEGGSQGLERVCLTSQPPIFAHHHPMDGESDIGGLGGGYATKYETKYLRYSVRMNLERLLLGKGKRELVDQWPDE